MIRLWISFVCCMHLYIKWQIWSLGLSCTIDGSRIEGHASLSSKHDRKHDHAHIWLKPHAMHCLFSVCCQNCLLQEVSADRQNSVPAGNLLMAGKSKQCRWKSWTAGGNSVKPVVLCNIQGTCPRVLAIFRKTGQCKQRWQRYGTGFSGEPGFEHASFAHREAEAAATLFFLLHSFFLIN